MHYDSIRSHSHTTRFSFLPRMSTRVVFLRTGSFYSTRTAARVPWIRRIMFRRVDLQRISYMYDRTGNAALSTQRCSCNGWFASAMWLKRASNMWCDGERRMFFVVSSAVFSSRMISSVISFFLEQSETSRVLFLELRKHFRTLTTPRGRNIQLCAAMRRNSTEVMRG